MTCQLETSEIKQNISTAYHTYFVTIAKSTEFRRCANCMAGNQRLADRQTAYQLILPVNP